MTPTDNAPNLPWIVKLTVLALPTVLFLLLCEWGASVYLKHKYGPEFDLAVQAAGEMAPSGYQLWEHPANYWNWLKTSRYNNLGFRRIEDTSIEKEPGTTRIFFMGGSGALGSSANPAYPWLQMSGQAQYSPDETISAYLERQLNAKYPGRRFEVINAATNWAQLHQQLLHYYRKIRYLQPDLVISMDGQNDAGPIFDQYLSWWDQAGELKVADLNANLRVAMRPFIARSNLLFLMAGIALAEKRQGTQASDQALVDRYKVLGKPADYQQQVDTYASANKELVARGVGFYSDHLQHFYDALNRDGVRALFIQQPELVMDHTKPLTDIERALQNYLFETPDSYAVNFYRSVEQAGERLKATTGLPFYSFLNIFGGASGEVYTDYTHLTPHGNELLAAKLVEIIEAEHPSLFTQH
jgi:hypothetical protein